VPGIGRFARDTLRRWPRDWLPYSRVNSPRIRPDADDLRHKPYLPEYPAEILWAKVRRRRRFSSNVRVPGSPAIGRGRWGFDGEYAGAVSHHGYIVDCSVTPGVSWRSSPAKSDGPDYRRRRQIPISWTSMTCANREERALEAPMTIVRLWPRADGARQAGLPERGRAALTA